MKRRKIREYSCYREISSLNISGKLSGRIKIQRVKFSTEGETRYVLIMGFPKISILISEKYRDSLYERYCSCMDQM